VTKYGDQVRTAPLDVADEGAANAAVSVAMNAFGRLDVVLNNAGYDDTAPFEQLSPERFKALIEPQWASSSRCWAAVSDRHLQTRRNPTPLPLTARGNAW
jgi:NAD(P)-dependent dehydrogenase (short-subunit alcohol dehydrogenase family)